ncbi:Tankyrase-1 [Apiospora hydei]|uniref:Tankyrase-1 n=1 Tax=Apiospora hydei TaxID=1337664 RepID=A0ABR1WRC0_9PEZI
MVQLLELPVDLLLEVVDHVDDPHDLTSLARVNRFFHSLADKRIWKLANREHRYGILMWACATGNEPALRRLLTLGFTTNLNFQPRQHWIPKEITLSFYLTIRSDLCLARQKRQDTSGATWGKQKARWTALPYMDDFYEPASPRLDQNDRQFWKPLHTAVYHGQSHIVDTLLQHGAWVDAIATNYHGCDRPPSRYMYEEPGHGVERCTPLHVALCTGQEEIARTLISNGASMHVNDTVYRWQRTCDPNRKRITAFHLCAHYGLLSTARYLVEQGYQTEVDELDEFGSSPIITRFTGPDRPLFFDSDSRSILHEAFRDRRWEIAVKLVEHGCDVHEPNNCGDTPLEICLRHYVYPFMVEEQTVSGMNRDAQEMIKTIEKCGMHGHLDGHILFGAAYDALSWAVPPLLSFIIDRGFDISTLLGSSGVSSRHPPLKPEPREYFIDTGLYSNRLTLIEFACYGMRPSAHLEEIIDLLLARGCIEAGDIDSHVTLPCENSRPKLPVALFFICLEQCQRDVLDELLNVFDFPDNDYSEHEMVCFLRALTDKTWNQDIANRRFDYPELVFKADKRDYLLRHKDTFRFLYQAFLKVDGGEKAILDYLDRGGRYSLFPDRANVSALYDACASNSLQLAERLINMGAHPRNLIGCDEPYSSDTSYRHSGLWIKNSGGPNRLEDPFCLYLYCYNDYYLHFFQNLCELTVSKKTDERYLLAMLKFACENGRHTGVQVLHSCARRKVDALIRDKAAFFLQTLLANFDRMCTSDTRDMHYIKQVDEAIDLIQLILELGPASTTTSRWRLGKISGYQPRSALELLEKLVTPPENPHSGDYLDWPCLEIQERHVYRVWWCLDQRIKIDTIKGKPNVTIKGGTIIRPSQLNDPNVTAAEAEGDLLEEIPLPWGCTCEEKGEDDW